MSAQTFADLHQLSCDHQRKFKYKQAEVELRLTQAEAVRLSFGCSLLNYEVREASKNILRGGGLLQSSSLLLQNADPLFFIK